MTVALVKYDAACRALAEAHRVDEVKDIRDKAVAMQAYARQAKDDKLIIQATNIRMRAERRAGELLREMKERGERAGKGQGDSKYRKPLYLPKLADLGVTATQSSRWQELAAMPEEKFEAVVADAHDKVERAERNAVREAKIKQERAERRAQTAQGGSVADLYALIASGFRAGVIAVDPPWEFKVYSGKGKQRSAERHYDTMSLDEIAALPVEPVAADACALLLWSVWSELPGALDAIRAWGFQYQTAGFIWVKQNASGEGLFTGMGYHTRANTESCLLATRGSPLRLAADVHQVIMSPVGAHSEKPDEAYRRMQRLYGGPYLELFARKPRDGWMTWGDEVPAPLRAAE